MERAFKDKAKEWTQVVKKALSDEEFKSKLVADPITVLGECGIEFPEGAKVNIVEGAEGAQGIKVDLVNENEINVALPSASVELSFEDLSAISGGHGIRSGGYGCANDVCQCPPFN